MDTIVHQHLAGKSALLQAPKQLDHPGDIAVGSQPHVVIIGAGFAGLSVAKALAKASVHVTLIDRRNYHLFQPLLYQVATAGLSPADIAMPIRSILSRQRNAIVVLARVVAINTATRIVSTDAREIPYDILIVATGARHAYFGHDEWKSVALGLKKIEDATGIRRQILLSFELAESIGHPAERRRLLNFVIVGGGPTGVELAGAIAELARKALACDFRHIDPRQARVILIEAGPRLLATFPEKLAAAAQRALQRLGVEVRVGQRVTQCDACGVVIAGERIEARTILWAAGVRRVTRSKMAPSEGRSSGPRARRARLDATWALGDFRDWRHGCSRRRNRQAVARRGVSGEAAGHLCGAGRAGAAQGNFECTALSLSRLRKPRDGRPEDCGRGFRLPSIERAPGVVAVGAHFLSTRLSQSDRHYAELAVGILYSSAARG